MIDSNGVAREIFIAYNLHNNFGNKLLRDEKVRAMLTQLDRNIEATQKEMINAGIVKECADCAANGEGTCCGKRTGYKYNSMLLLVNLLLGKSLPLHAQDSHSCYFLKDEGCILSARHVICVNFICPRLHQNIQHYMLIRLQEVAGEELNILFLVEEYIKKKIGLFHTSVMSWR
jgi:hypothetical protein